MNQTYNQVDIYCDDEFINPTISSPNTSFELPFYQTKDTLMDVEIYKRFLDNAMSRFRHSRDYKLYKSYLMGLGLDRCQFQSNLTSEMCSIEMHHHFLTLFDISLIITEHVLNTKGYISTFDLVKLLKEEHLNNRVGLVMLSETSHQLYHNNPDFFIHPNMLFGNWAAFLNKYNRGITQDVAFKILFYLKRAIEEGGSKDNELLTLYDNIQDWSMYNG